MSDQVTLEEVWSLFKATDERFKATDERIGRLNDAAERSRAETEASHRKTEAALRELSRQMGRFSNQIGEFAEAMVVPAAKNIFLNRGIPVHTVARNLEGERNGKAIEVDILVVNNDHAVVVEVKNRPKIDHVNQHLERMAIFKEIFPAYRDYKLLGALAGITVDDNVARYAYRRGLFVLGQNGETVTILNDDAFKPAVW